MRPIDADALIEKCGEWYTEEGCEEGFIGTLKQLLDKQPTIEPKQGEWIWNQYDGNPAIGNYHCSICRRLVPHDKYAYCPTCGAKNERSGR